jgi:hypothetical protein
VITGKSSRPWAEIIQVIHFGENLVGALGPDEGLGVARDTKNWIMSRAFGAVPRDR